MVDIKKEFGLKVKKYRNYANLAQEELAEKAGITPQTLSGIENGHGFPSYPVLCKLVQALDVAPLCLFTFPTQTPSFDNEELQAIILEDFKALNQDNRKIILHMIQYLREQQK